MSAQRAGGLLVCALAYVVLFGYALARPGTESMFLHSYGASRLPSVWIAVALSAFAVVAVYNRAATRHPLRDVMLGAVALSAASLLSLLWLGRAGVRAADFALYVWKDVHIVVLLEALWSFANLIFSQGTARWFYGVFCASGSLGGVTGNLATGALARRWGTGSALWLVLAAFALEVVLIWWLARAAGHPAPRAPAKTTIRDDWQLVSKSRYLGWMLALVGVVQVVITLVDYAFNDAIAKAYPAVDARTEVIGWVYAAIDGSSLVLQLGTGLVLRAAGLRLTLLAIPAIIGAVVTGFALVPRFALMALTKIASKVFDYSLFRAAKEMLYLPLSYAEKTRGKAIVDVLTYRVAKGGASLILALLVTAGARTAVLLVILALVVAWLAVTVVLMRRHHDLTTSEDAR